MKISFLGSFVYLRIMGQDQTYQKEPGLVNRSITGDKIPKARGHLAPNLVDRAMSD